MPEFSQDTLALWRRVTKEEDVALYMHYSGVFDIKYCNEHPEECAVSSNGTIDYGTTKTNGKYVDDILIPQLSELAERYNIDGIWVDGECWKATVDFSPESIAAFEKETGIGLGGRIPATPNDPYYDEYREYHREQFRRYLRYYVDKLHEKFPELQITSNWAFSDHMPEIVSANVDFLSGDLNPANSLNSARYAGRALAQQNYPWDLMSWNFRRAVGGQGACVAKHPVQIMQEAASVIALGGAYQNYIMQYKDGSPNMIEVRNLRDLPEFLRSRQPFCFRGTQIHQAALLLSTYDRHRESKNLYARTGYERVMGMSALLCDVGQSLEIVCEHTLEQNVNEYKMIVVPELYRGLADETLRLLMKYAENGGKLVLVGCNTCNIFASLDVPFDIKAVDKYLAKGQVAYDNGGETGHADNSVHKYKSYYFTVDGTTFGAMFAPCRVEAQEAKVEAYFTEKMCAEKLPLAITVPYGKGSITAIGFEIGSQYLKSAQYMHSSLIKHIADSLYTPMVRVESVCGKLEVIVLSKDGKIMIQLVNTGGSHSDETCATDDYIPPVLNIELSIELSKAPLSLVLQPEGKKLPFKYNDGRAYVSVERVDIHSIIEVRD